MCDIQFCNLMTSFCFNKIFRQKGTLALLCVLACIMITLVAYFDFSSHFKDGQCAVLLLQSVAVHHLNGIFFVTTQGQDKMFYQFAQWSPWCDTLHSDYQNAIYLFFFSHSGWSEGKAKCDVSLHSDHRYLLDLPTPFLLHRHLRVNLKCGFLMMRHSLTWLTTFPHTKIVSYIASNQFQTGKDVALYRITILFPSGMLLGAPAALRI